jgi:hypothetical protein
MWIKYNALLTRPLQLILILLLKILDSQFSAPSSKALKKALLGDNPIFFFSTFSFIRVLEVITTVMTALYPFYFVFVPREASNSSEVKIWGCCCPETVFGAAP